MRPRLRVEGSPWRRGRFHCREERQDRKERRIGGRAGIMVPVVSLSRFSSLSCAHTHTHSHSWNLSCNHCLAGPRKHTCAALGARLAHMSCGSPGSTLRPRMGWMCDPERTLSLLWALVSHLYNEASICWCLGSPSALTSSRTWKPHVPCPIPAEAVNGGRGGAERTTSPRPGLSRALQTKVWSSAWWSWLWEEPLLSCPACSPTPTQGL